MCSKVRQIVCFRHLCLSHFVFSLFLLNYVAQYTLKVKHRTVYEKQWRNVPHC